MNVLAFVQAWDADDPANGFIVEWMASLAGRVAMLTVVALRVNPSTPFPRSGMRLHSLGKERYAGFGRSALYLRRFHRIVPGILATDSIDVIFTHMTPTYSLCAWPYARFRRIPIVTWFAHPRRSIRLAAADAVSARVVTAVAGSYPYPGAKVIPIGHGINMRLFSPASLSRGMISPGQSRPLLISAGRIAPIKRHEILIDALSVLKSRGMPCDAVFVGNPAVAEDLPYAAMLRARVRHGDLDRHITFASGIPRSALPERYRSACACVNLTSDGSFDKAALEAMACGMPTIVASANFKDILGPYADMLLFSGTDAEGLAGRIAAVAALSAGDRIALGAHLRSQVMRSHGLGGCMDRLVGILRSASA